jgi:hypothetical protein
MDAGALGRADRDRAGVEHVRARAEEQRARAAGVVAAGLTESPTTMLAAVIELLVLASRAVEAGRVTRLPTPNTPVPVAPVL